MHPEMEGATRQRTNSESRPTTMHIAWIVAGLSMVLGLIALGLAFYPLVVSIKSSVPPLHIFFTPVGVFIFSITGALIASHHPRNPIGWLFEIVGFTTALTVFSLAYYSIGQSIRLPGMEFMVWLQTWVWIPPSFLPLTLLLLLFPDGNLPSKWWRPILWTSIISLVGHIIIAGFNPDQAMQEAFGLPEANPYAINGFEEVWSIMLDVVGVLLVISVLGSIIVMIIRFLGSHGTRRNQMKWLAYACSFAIFAIACGVFLTVILPNSQMASELGIIIVELMVSGIALATGVAIIWNNLYDIDLLINRTIVYIALTIVVVGVYILIVGTLSAAFQAQTSLAISLLATGVVAVGFQPVRERLQRGVNRLMYGERDEPYLVLSRLGRRLEGTLAPNSVLSTIVETVAQALKLPYVAIALESAGASVIAASTGEPITEQLTLPLSYQSERVGQLICGLRGPNESFSAAERTLLQDVAHQAGIAVHAVRLNHNLQRARRRLVQTREEERRRIRRDLHDGLGPILASQRLKIGSARAILQTEPQSADELLAEIERALTTALDDIRRLVYDLRPPALDELGLVQAIKHSLHPTPDLDITIAVSGDLSLLPAAVDLAAYRIVQEALSNVIQHAQANCVDVNIETNGHLIISIKDDGTGLMEDYVPGIGISSMRERTEELGGTFNLNSTSGEGILVTVHIPLEDAQW